MERVHLFCPDCNYKKESEIIDGVFNNTCNICGQTMKFDIKDNIIEDLGVEGMMKVAKKFICTELYEIKVLQKQNLPKITQNDINDLKIDLELFGKKK